VETLGRAKFEVLYNQKDISSDLLPYLLSIKYKDNSEGKADELVITLENVDGFWENDWYPVKGDTLQCKIGIEAMMDCGKFEIDSIEIASPPDTVTINAISSVITGGLRTKKNKAHENTTLKEIVDQVASANGLTVTGQIADVQFVRITQHRENDLAFLRRLSQQFGYFFSIRGDQLVFENLFGVISGGSVSSIDREDCLGYQIKDQSAKTATQSNLNFHDRKTGKVTTYTYTPSESTGPGGVPLKTVEGPAFTTFMPAGTEYKDEGAWWDAPATNDSLELFDRVENDGQAEVVSKAALLRSNMNQQEGSLTIQGNPLLVAGSNFQWTGIGKLAGKYHIATSEHEITTGGYLTMLEVKRVALIEQEKGKRKRTEVRKNYSVKVL